MNITYFLKEVPVFLIEICYFFLVIVLIVPCVFLILPFCKRDYTIGAGYKWFAWYPILVKEGNHCRLRDFRWLVFVGRRGFFGATTYEDLKERM